MRVTVRRMMVAVALSGLLIVVAIPVGRSLIWLYNAPKSYELIHCSLDPWADGLRKPISAGQVVPVRFPYRCEVPETTPPWLPYRVSVEVKVIHVAPGQDQTTGTVEYVHNNSHILINGIGSWAKADGELGFDLKPSRPGTYIVRYETHVTDAMGRNGMAECNNAGFEAH